MAKRNVAPSAALTAEEQFFYDHAGYSYDPKKETQAEGRTRCAILLAAAEAVYLRAHQLADVDVEWGPDDDAAADSDPDNGPFESCEVALIARRTTFGTTQYMASLGAIWDADDDYRRVIRAELALECVEQLAAACVE